MGQEAKARVVGSEYWVESMWLSRRAPAQQQK